MGALYDNIGKSYDTTRKADPEIVRKLHNHLNGKDYAAILDVACGTGNYTIALSQRSLRMTGVDISEQMLHVARQKSTGVDWVKADAGCLPYNDEIFDGVTCVLAIHHFNNLLAPFEEVHRVLKAGRFVVFTSSPEQMQKYWLNEYFPKAMEESIRQMPPINLVLEVLTNVGFSHLETESFLVQPELEDFFLYSGKHEPAMYLDSKVRSGISTFANLATPEEIESGCRRLKADLESGKFQDVIRDYTSALGDYTFIVAEK